MSRTLVLIILILMTLILMPGLKISHEYISSASTHYVIVTFILNESKEITSEYALTWGSVYEVQIDQSESFYVPVNITLYIYSQYPFETIINNKTEYAVQIAPYMYAKNITIINDTTIYINFVQKVPKNITAPLVPMYSCPHHQSYTQNQIETVQYESVDIPINTSVILLILIMVVIVILLLVMRKVKK